MRILLLSLLVALARAQAPVSAILLDSNTNANLGAAIFWTYTAGSTYDVYGKSFTYKQDCTKITSWTELTSNLNGFSYSHYPVADQYGWGGYWCYGISANGGPVVPIHWPVAMGMKWYVNLFLDAKDCSARLGGVNPPQFQVVVTRVRNGVPTVMPQSEGVNPYRYAGFMRLLSYDTVNVTITLPDGNVLNFPNAFNIGGVPEIDDAAPYLVVEINSDGTDSLCSVQTWNYMQKGGSNR